jgi:hypothetical protein
MTSHWTNVPYGCWGLSPSGRTTWHLPGHARSGENGLRPQFQPRLHVLEICPGLQARPVRLLLPAGRAIRSEMRESKGRRPLPPLPRSLEGRQLRHSESRRRQGTPRRPESKLIYKAFGKYVFDCLSARLFWILNCSVRDSQNFISSFLVKEASLICIFWAALCFISTQSKSLFIFDDLQGGVYRDLRISFKDIHAVI